MAIIKGNKYEWEYVIGLEVHSQVISESKLFSGASTKFGGSPNSQVSLVDAAMPGMLPTLNEYCVRQAIKTGLGLNAIINRRSVFDRKNYFYADLPQGYQISQFYHPIITGGEINIINENGEHKLVRIHHIHLEQDAGKSMHDQSPTKSFIDLNRAGIALMEIVSEPDMRSPYEAAEYLKKLRAILRYLGTCDGDMEKGSLRCDANVSVRRPGDQLGTRCEIKNVNSVKNVVKAIEYEAYRQIEILENGGSITQETRLFDANTGSTRSMRDKENSHDYRYFPDPDLLPLIIEDELINEVKSELPELPDQKIARYMKNYGLSEYDSAVISADKEVADYFERLIAISNDPKLSANWLTVELFGYFNKSGKTLSDSYFTPEILGELIALIKNDVISGKIAKQVFEIIAQTGDKPSDIVEREGLRQVTDESFIINIINKVLDDNEDSVKQYFDGKEKLFGFFIGNIMKESKGKANPASVNKLLKEELEKRR